METLQVPEVAHYGFCHRSVNTRRCQGNNLSCLTSGGLKISSLNVVYCVSLIHMSRARLSSFVDKYPCFTSARGVTESQHVSCYT